MSQFLNNGEGYRGSSLPGIDFGSAVRLRGGGSTCDIFRTRWQRREVFVKRLKEEYRSKPLYLDALDKEYEIGVGLKHPSLPDYREFHRDYIVMDYIDGTTLDEMIRRRDPWLADGKNIHRMHLQLVDVVDYLHTHNVAHCDIKPDNIMLTAKGHNLVLIDFDKCYTDALSDTSGDPAKYGMTADDAGSFAIDFHGIARVAERLRSEVPGFKLRRYREFVRACLRPDVTCDELTAMLGESRPATSRIALAIGAGVLVIGLITLLTLYLSGSDKVQEPGTPPVIAENHGPVPTENDKINDKTGSTTDLEMREYADIAKPTALSPENATSGKAEAVITLDENLRPYFNELATRLDRLVRLKDDPTLSARQLSDSLSSYSRIESEDLSESISVAHRLFPSADENELGDMISGTPSYAEYWRRAKPLKRELREEIEHKSK